MLNPYQTNRITQCLNLLSMWRVKDKDKSPIGNDIQHDSNELLARHQPYLESLKLYRKKRALYAPKEI